MIKESIQQGDIIIKYLYTKPHCSTFTEMKGEIDNNIVIVGSKTPTFNNG